MRSAAFILCVAGSSAGVAAFTTGRSQVSRSQLAKLDMTKQNDCSMEFSRRDAFGKAAAAVLGASTVGEVLFVPPAQASGGATAGGAYLLSAKQRYNSRVTAGIKAFLALSASLEAGSTSEAAAFLASDAEGGWGDLKSAGYLLSNAFRRSSTTPPDSLPSVKAWKAFQGEVEKMNKAIDKKSKSGAAEAYKKAEAALDDYLEKVELPPIIEMRQG